MGSYDEIPSALLGAEGGSRRAAPYGLVRVSGLDTNDFLQRLCSQDMEALAEEKLLPAAFLNGKGRLLFLVILCSLGEEVYLETQVDQAEELAEYLERYHFGEQLVIEFLAKGECTEMVSMTPFGDLDAGSCRKPGDEGLVLCFQRRGMFWWRQHGGAGEVDLQGRRELAENEAEILRMLTGLPRVGVDSDDSTLAMELPIHDHLSTNKGCYTGQEVVARIHTYGHTNRQLCVLGVAGRGEMPAGTSICELDEGEAVGRVSSAREVPGRGCRIALGYLPSVFCAKGTRLRAGEDEVLVLSAAAS